MESSEKSPLTFKALREANAVRCPMFKNAQGETQHSGRDWNVGDWYIAVLGELGEAANQMKKIRRGDYVGLSGTPKLAGELADVIIYFDMLCDSAARTGRVTYFDDFRTLRAVSRMMVKHWPEMGPAACMGRAAMYFGNVWRSIDSVRVQPQTITGLHQFLLAVDMTANSFGIDLGSAVVRTFNAKSRELKLPVFITDDNFIRDEDPEVTSGPKEG